MKWIRYGIGFLMAIPSLVWAQTTYNIGEIPPQRIWYNADGSELVFGLQAPTLGDSPTITATYNEAAAPSGITFDPELDRFRYRPSAQDTEPFAITFIAVGAGPTIIQEVQIEPLQPLPPEQEAFGVNVDPSTLPDPESRDYLRIEDRANGDAIAFNDSLTPIETRSATIIGKHVVFEEGHRNGLFEDYSGLTNLRDLTIHADQLIIRTTLDLPQTEVTINARELIFEGSARSRLNRAPCLWVIETRRSERADGQADRFIC